MIVDAGNDTTVCNDTIKLTATTLVNPVQSISGRQIQFYGYTKYKS